MKITQDLIVFDLEATSSETPEGNQENKNIIQIGAVYLKRVDNKKYDIVDTFGETIKPKNEIISPFIEELTGITNEDVKDRPYFKEVGKSFVEWVNKHGTIKSTRLCAWGNYFDIPLLRKHYERESMVYPFSGTAYDVKSWACLWMMLSGRKTNKMSVGSLAKIMNIEYDGQLHDARTDALITAKIALKIFDDLDHGFFIDSEGKSQGEHFSIIRS